MRTSGLAEFLGDEVAWTVEDVLDGSDFNEDEISEAVNAIRRFAEGYITQAMNQKISEQQDRATDDAIAERRGLD